MSKAISMSKMYLLMLTVVFLLASLLLPADLPGSEGSVNLYPSVKIQSETSDSQVSNSLPRRDDPGEDWIFYDDGGANTIYTTANLWGKVTFTVNAEFELWGVSVRIYNVNEIESPCYVRIYSEDQDDHDLDDMLHEFELEEVPNNEWIWLELEEDDRIDFEQGENFTVLYGPAPSGDLGDGDAGWWVLADETAESDRSFVAIGDDPPDSHRDWFFIGEVGENPGHDLLIRANGEYTGEITDVEVITVYNGSEDEPGKWSHWDNDEVTFFTQVTNLGGSLDTCTVNFTMIDSRGRELFSSDVELEDFESGDTLTLECPELWEVDDPYGTYRMMVTSHAAWDVDELNSVKGLEQFAIHQEDSRDDWLGYSNGDIGSWWYFNDNEGSWGAMFYHPGGIAPLWLTDFRAMVRADDEDIELGFSVFNLNVDGNQLDRRWEGSTVLEEGEHWVEFNLEEEDHVMMEQGEAIMVAWEMEENTLLRRENGPPNSASAFMMPSVMWGSGDGERFGADTLYDCAIQAKLAGPDEGWSGLVHGYVTEFSDGDPIEDAMISTSGGSRTFTDEDGYYSIRDWRGGTFSVTASMEGYNDSTLTEIRLDSRDTLDADFALTKPLFLLSVEELIGNIPPDSSSEEIFAVQNFGNGILEWSSRREWQGEINFEPWEERGDFNAARIVDDDRLTGVAFIDGYFYVAGSDNDTNKVYVFDGNGDLIRDFPQVGEAARGMTDLAWDGELIWGSGERTVYGFTEDGDLETSFEGAWSPNKGLAWDRDRDLLWMCSSRTGITGMNREGEVEIELDRTGFTINSLVYCPDDPDFYPLYILHEDEDENVLIHKVDPETGDFMFVTELDVDGSAEGSFATNEFDRYSWVYISMINNSPDEGGDRIDLYNLHPNVSWMQLEPAAGSVPPDDEMDVSLLFDASGLARDLYMGELVFTHNAEGGEFRIDVELNVAGGPRPPTPFNLELPEDGDTVGVEEIEFAWRPSFDPNPGEDISYMLWIEVNEDSVNHPSEETSITVNLAESYLNYESGDRFNWWVIANSGDDYVECNFRYNFIYVPSDVGKHPHEIPDEFAINGVYPNPFNSSFELSYSLNEPSNTEINIYDFNGRLISHIALGEKRAGYYHAVFDTKTWSSGIYLIQIEANGIFRSAKVVSLK